MSSSPPTSAVISWVGSAIPELTAVILTGQELADAPRPALPYATVEWTVHRTLSATPYEVTLDDIIAPGEMYDTAHDAYQRIESTLRVTIYGQGGAGYLHELLLSLRRVTTKATLRDAGCAVRALGGVLDTDIMRTTEWEPSAAVDLGVTWVASDRSAVARIETIETPITTT